MRLEKTVESFTLYCDNKINIALTKNAESQYCSKYINIQYYQIRKLVNKKEPTIKQISKSEILVEKMTKWLSIETFKKYQALQNITIN